MLKTVNPACDEGLLVHGDVESVEAKFWETLQDISQSVSVVVSLCLKQAKIEQAILG